MAKTWTRSEIRALVRKLTGRRSTSQMADASIDEAINDYYMNHFPLFVHASEFNSWYQKETAPSDSGEYDIPENILLLTQPCYIDGNPISYEQNETDFFRKYPREWKHLVGYWSLDGGVAVDNSGNGNNGSITGSPTTVAGVSGSALQFDGTNDWIDLAGLTLNGVSSLSYSVWFCANSVQDGDIIGPDGWGNDLVRLVYDSANTRFRATMRWGTDTSYNLYSSSITTSQWYHLVVTADIANSKFKFYVDGSLIDSVSIDSTGTYSNTNDYSIGRDYDNAYVDGRIDEVRIYSKALTATEVEELYNNVIERDRDEPSDVLVYGDKFYLRPKPDDVYRFEAKCKQKPSELTSDSSTPTDVRWAPAIAHGTAILILTNNNEDVSGNIAAAYEGYLKSINREFITQLSKNTRAKPKW